MGVAGTGTATEMVAWINGHPEYTDLPVVLDHERVVIVGNGNVALDVARILTADPDVLARTDISDHALAALRDSTVTEVVIAARRGPAQSAFTLPELIGLTSTCDVVLDGADHELVLADLAVEKDPLTRNKLEMLSKLGDASAPATRPRIRLAYRLTPRRVLGAERVTGIEFDVTDTGRTRRLDAGQVLTSIGYRGKPIRDLPFDETAAAVPNDGGRVVEPQSGQPVCGSYVAGWIKRGPTGFIGTNKSASLETVLSLVDDYNAGRLPDPAGQARRPGQAGARAAARTWSTPPDGTPSTPPKSPAVARTGRGTNSPPSPTCWPRRPTAPAPPLRQRVLAGLRR